MIQIDMKTIGLLGGMSWESTELYYRWINQGVKQRLGGLHSARIAMVSVDFQEIETLQHAGDWERSGQLLAAAGRSIEAAGADFLLICTNTMHKVAPQVEAAIDIPLLHLADATAARIKAAGMSTIGLLGTNFTMEQDFYRGRLAEKHGLTLLQFASIWNLSHPAVECVVPTFIQETGEGARPIEDKIRELAEMPDVRFSSEEVESIREIGDNTGCMSLKGASKRHEVSERPDEWPMRDDLLEIAGRHGLGTDW